MPRIGTAVPPSTRSPNLRSGDGPGTKPGRKRPALVRQDATLFARNNAFVPSVRVPIRPEEAELRELLGPDPELSSFRFYGLTTDPAPPKQPSPRKAATFGMDPRVDLQPRKEARLAEFGDFDRLAKEMEAKKAGSKRYDWKEVDVPGGDKKTRQLVKARKNRRERFAQKQGELGKQAQEKLNQLSGRVHDLTHMPRTTGGNYLSAVGDDPLGNHKTLPLDYALVAQSGARLGNGVAGANAGLNDPDMAPDTAAAADVLAFGAPVLAAADALVSTDALLKLVGERDKAKATVLRCREGFERFLTHMETATPQEANDFLQFVAAAEKVFAPTQEDISTLAAAKDRAARLAVIQPPSVAITAGIEIANNVTSQVPFANLVTAPLTAAAAVIDIHEGTNERLRRLDQQQRAEQRKAAMADVLKKWEGHPEHALLEGIVASLSAQQDRLIRQAKKEKGFGKVKAGKGGAALGAMTGVVVTGSLAAAGILAVPTFGVSALGALVPPTAWAMTQAARNHGRVRAEHTSKWRQRAAGALSYQTSREVLEQKLAGTHPNGPGLRVEFQEGEYLPEEERFAGSREMEFDARDNEYVGLHALALQVQDMIKNDSITRESPYVQLLAAIGVDPLMLLAIAKTASAEPPHAQLDSIQSQLALKQGMKLRVQGAVQALPHVSVFLGHFQDALSDVRERYAAGDAAPDLHAELRTALAARYPDPAVHMRAFDLAIEGFLKKTQHLPMTDLRALLRGVVDVPKREGSPSKPAAKDKDVHLAAVEWEADRLIDELKLFASRPIAAQG